MQPAEVALPRCFVEKEFLEISQNSQEFTCARVSFLINLQAKANLQGRQGTDTYLGPCQLSLAEFSCKSSSRVSKPIIVYAERFHAK